MNVSSTVLVAGGDNLFQKGLCAVVQQLPALHLQDSVSATAQGGLVLREALGRGPALALVDLHELGSTELPRAVHACVSASWVRCAFVALPAQLRVVRPLLPAGATVLPPSVGAAELGDCLAALQAGRPAPVCAAHDADTGPALGEALTPREREILLLLAAGQSNSRMAVALGVAVPTVKFHIGNLLRKLGVTSRTQAVVHACRLQLVEPQVASLR